MTIENLTKALSELKTHHLGKFKLILSSFKDVIILGNGGSNAVAQHIAQDYTKVLNKRAFCFADASRLTCYMNDYGVEDAYLQFVKHFHTEKTLVILISSSGNSKNIINVAEHCIVNKIPFVTLSGFSEDNKLNQLGQKAMVNVWVDSDDYGVVELTHEAFLHSIC